MIDLLATYMEDLRDNLAAFNAGLMQLKTSVKNKDAVDSLFRVVHTIKGNSAAIEFFHVEKVMHSMEDILHEVRQGSRELTQDLINLLYVCHDFLEDFLHKLESGSENVQEGSSKLLEHLLVFKGLHEGNLVHSTMHVATADMETSHHPSQKFGIEEVDVLSPYESDVPDDVWEILLENVKRGLTAYSISIILRDGCQMKELRAWMVLRELTNLGLLVYSNPEFAGDMGNNLFVSSFEGCTIHALILHEGVSDAFAAAMMDQLDVQNATAEIIEKDRLIARINHETPSLPLAAQQ